MPRCAAHGQKLRWAALLHEAGMAVSHEDYHKHGEYIVRHADAAGFAEHQLARLSTLVLAQRGGLRKVEERLAADALLRDQVLALRMAIIFCHARRDPAPAQMRIGHHARGLGVRDRRRLGRGPPAVDAPAARGREGLVAHAVAAAAADD